MATVESVQAEVNQLVTSLKGQATDATEQSLLLYVAFQALQVEATKAARDSEEHKAELVLAARAAMSGVSVDDQKEEIASMLKIRAEDLKAADALLTLKATDAQSVDAQPAPAPAQVAPAGP